ncbi:Uma2 family endonuclease [Actinoplanes solisilvae]|uniref:Uma2 family endonuclease n=1 Tax=Actinoplanes solisilvae TaxID=2486853 RepID=UPI000FDA4007|nr:Uma2 family endonuclease [Actinoplanes solisilvae]
MTAAMSDMPPKDDWTSDDLDRFPEDGIRREIFDGVLHVTPSPSSVHQSLALLLGAALMHGCPDEFFVSQANDVVVDPSRRFAPDLLVVNFEAAKSRSHKFAAADVVLAAEIVSSSTTGIDRVSKPTFYAQAGIQFFWLIETIDGLSVSVFELDPVDKHYEQIGIFTSDDTISLDRPWPIEIPLSTIRPRNL